MPTRNCSVSLNAATRCGNRAGLAAMTRIWSATAMNTARSASRGASVAGRVASVSASSARLAGVVDDQGLFLASQALPPPATHSSSTDGLGFGRARRGRCGELPAGVGRIVLATGQGDFAQQPGQHERDCHQRNGVGPDPGRVQAALTVLLRPPRRPVGLGPSPRQSAPSPQEVRKTLANGRDRPTPSNGETAGQGHDRQNRRRSTLPVSKTRLTGRLVRRLRSARCLGSCALPSPV
jgi:hypothetical protein